MRSLTIVWLLAICLVIFRVPPAIAETAETGLEHFNTRLFQTWVDLMLTHNDDVLGQPTTVAPTMEPKSQVTRVIRLGRIIRTNYY